MDEQKPIIDITSEPAQPKRPSGGQSASNGSARDSAGDEDFQQGLERVMNRRRRFFIILLILFGSAALYWTWSQPYLYKATGSILVSRMGTVPAPVTQAEIASEVEMIRSQVAELPASAAGTTRVAESLQASEARRADLKKRIQVRVLDGSQVIEVSFTDPARKTSADTVNLLMELYLQQRFRMFSSPMHMVNIEAEEASLNARAEQARLELAAFDKQNDGPTARDEHQLQNHHRIAIEERAIELKGTIRAQEEVVRILKLRGVEGNGSIEAEARLAGLRAQLKETESALTPVARADVQYRSVAAQREELKSRAEQTAAQASQISSRIRDARLQGVMLQTRILSRAEPALMRSFEVSWWKLALLAIGALLAAWIGAWISDLFNRPVYHDDDFTDLTGAPPIRTRSAAAGK